MEFLLGNNYVTRQNKNNKDEQICISNYEVDRKKNVQAFVMNMTACSSLEELVYIDEEMEGRLDIDIALDPIIREDEASWSVPRWAKIGDIIFFAFGKRANSKISATRTALKQNILLFSQEKYNRILALIDREQTFYKKYGGTIFAVGRLKGFPETTDYSSDDAYEIMHYKSRVFADIDDKYVLERPVHVNDCSDFLQIVMTSSITPVMGDVFDFLKNKISENNEIPLFLKEAEATPIPLLSINDENWMKLSNDYRRAFMYEGQFRHFYVDRFLKKLSDIDTIYSECKCKKEGIGLSFIDNVILMNKMYWPVEVKLSIFLEKDIKKQVRKYCFDDYIILNENGKSPSNDRIVQDEVIVVDTEAVYVYRYSDNQIYMVIKLDDITNINDVEKVKKAIVNHYYLSKVI